MPWRGAGGSRVQLSTQVRDAQRARLAEIVHALRDTAVRIAEAVEVWRRAVASSSPPPPLGSTARPPYLHRGHNVLVRLLVDAPALPLPLMSDPLLVRWFGAHAPLWAGGGAADAAAFAPPPTERRRLEHAAALLRTRPYLTRMVTALSPDEMRIDPSFHPRGDLPEVVREHWAERIVGCSGPARLQLPDGREVEDGRLGDGRVEVRAVDARPAEGPCGGSFPADPARSGTKTPARRGIASPRDRGRAPRHPTPRRRHASVAMRCGDR